MRIYRPIIFRIREIYNRTVDITDSVAINKTRLTARQNMPAVSSRRPFFRTGSARSFKKKFFMAILSKNRDMYYNIR